MIGVVLALGAVISVLAFGGVETLGFTPAQVAIVLLATVLFWRRGFPPISRATVCVLGALAGIPLFQLIPLPRSVVAMLSPARVALTDNLMIFGMPLPGTLALTVNSYETQLAFLRLICYILVFLLAFEVYRLRGQAIALIGVLIGLGIFEAAYGSIQYLTGWQYIYTYRKLFSIEEATGTYINRNHFAGLLEMVLPFLLAGILFRRWRHGSSARSPWVEIIVSPITSRLVRDLVLFALIFVALIFSRSRMGIAAGITGILIVGAVAVLQTRRKSVLLLLSLILVLPVAYSMWIGLTPVVQRYEVLGRPGVIEGDRLPIWGDAVALIRDYPLFGTGLGTYRLANRHYQSHMLEVIFEHAHSDYLEFASEIGIPLTGLLFGSLWLLVVKVARRTLILERSGDRILGAGCAGAIAAILVHGITDFNLQIPANAYLFSWIAGTAAALVHKPVEAGSGRP